MFALDTNTVVYAFKGLGGIAERLLDHPPGEIGIPTIVAYELSVGVEKSPEAKKRRKQLDAFLASVVLLPFGLIEARTTASVRAKLETIGKPIGPIDTLIAGVALTHRVVLVTRNMSEFKRVDGLRVESWYREA